MPRASDSTVAAPDRLLDFSRSQGDRIDLRGVDANEQATGDQAFKFIALGVAGGGDRVAQVYLHAGRRDQFPVPRPTFRLHRSTWPAGSSQPA
jgi:hypothetical protein